MLIRALKSMPAPSLAAAGRANLATGFERVARLIYTGPSKWGLSVETSSSPRKISTVSKPLQRGGHVPKMDQRNIEEEEEEEEARPYVCPSACVHATGELLK